MKSDVIAIAPNGHLNNGNSDSSAAHSGEWRNAVLGPLTIKVGSGITPKGGSTSYLTSGIPLIRSQNVYPNELRLDGVAHISQKQHALMANSAVQPGDVLLNITGASIGRACVAPDSLGEANVNQHVCIIRCSEKLLPMFLSQYLNSDLGQRQIDSFQAGGNREGLNYDQIRRFQIPFPPLPEQRRIAEILGAWDRALERLAGLIAAKEKRKRGLMQRFLVGRIPASHHRADLGVDITTLPEGWRVVEFGEFVARSTEQFDPRNEALNLPCIELEHLEPNSGRLLGNGNSMGKDSQKNIFHRGQVLYGKLRPYLRKYWRAVFDGICSSEIWVLDAKDQVAVNDFLFFLLQGHDFTQVAMATSGSKMPRVDWEFLAEAPFVLPPLEEQRRIASILSLCDLEIDTLKDELDAVKRQKKGLMQQLLTGKVRVNGSAHVIAEPS